MRVTILHNAVTESATPDERDVLVQAAAVTDALRELGHEVTTHACDLNLDATRQLLADPPDVVFNLVESLGGSDRLMFLAPALLDAMQIPYGGCPAEAIVLTTHKVFSKRLLLHAGLPTPPWVAGGENAPHCTNTPRGTFQRQWRYIVKAVFEHASFGLDDDCLVSGVSEAELQDIVRARASQWGRPCFAEQYIEGREFNVSLLAGPSGPQVLPLAQIDFSAFPADKPRIVGYQAKWAQVSFEYLHTPRTLDGPCDAALAEQLAALSKSCWNLFGLRGWARVDFRVDERGQPWILEVNVNPCLSPDAGFAAALERAGIGFPAAIERILADARG